MDDRSTINRSSMATFQSSTLAVEALVLLATLSIFGCSRSRTENAAINNGLPAKSTELGTSPDAAAPSDAKVTINSASSASELATPGRALYLQHCAACHGERGDGQGIAARFLYPKPRDFQSGRFRLISTANMVPTRDDLLAVLRRGMPGSSMPSWEHLSDKDRNLLVDEILKMRHDGLHDQIVARLKEDDDEVVEADVLADVERRTTPSEVLMTPELSAADDERDRARPTNLLGKRLCRLPWKRGTRRRPTGDGRFRRIAYTAARFDSRNFQRQSRSSFDLPANCAQHAGDADAGQSVAFN